jgi:hypothetical protein
MKIQLSKMLSNWRHIYSHIYFTDKALNILFKFVCRLRNVSKNKNFEFSHNLKWYIIRTSFERVLRNIQKNLLLIPKLSRTCCNCHQTSVRDQMETWRKVLSRHAGNSSRQFQRCRPDRLEFYLDDSCDRLKRWRLYFNGTEKRQRGKSIATIRWGQRSPLGDRVCLFKTAASCLYDPWVRN